MSGPIKITWAAVAPDDDDHDYWTVCAFDGDPKHGIMADVIAEVTSLDEEKDARLIAASPDLLAACLAMVTEEDALIAELRAKGELPDLTEAPWSLVDQMRAAIAKATTP